jgi:DNA-binding beta-propeller fold protein YncE
MKLQKYKLIFLIFIFSKVFSQPFQINQAIYLFSITDDSASGVQLKGASGLSVDLSGAIYISDTENNRILKFNLNGKLIKSIGGFGWEKEQFYTPLDICASSALDVFVADYNNHRIQRYDKDLNYISSLYSDENWDETFQFAYPKSMVVSIHGDLFIIDGENIRLLMLNSFGEPEMSFGDFSEGKGRLVDPVQITMSSKDRLFVSDSQANKIIVFDYFGNYLSEIGTDFLKNPQGLYFSSLNLLFVADSGNKRIAIFDQDGALFFQWSIISDELGKFQNPVDVVSFGKRIFVLDEDKVFVFELK